MSDETRSGLPDQLPSRRPDEETPVPGESFLSRFHRRKIRARQTDRENLVEADPPVVESPVPATADTEADTRAEPPIELTDADMPPLEALDSDSDYTGFLSSRVSESLRRAALRKLFHGVEFNVVDGLDEYADDFTVFEPLGGLITADMRHQLETEARQRAEALKRSLLEQEGDQDDEVEIERDRRDDPDGPPIDAPAVASGTPGSTAGRDQTTDGGEPGKPSSPPVTEL